MREKNNIKIYFILFNIYFKKMDILKNIFGNKSDKNEEPKIIKIKQNPIKIEIYLDSIILSSVDEHLKINKALEINRI